MIVLLFAMIVLVNLSFVEYAASSENRRWTYSDMSRSVIEVKLDPESETCTEAKCTFLLHYFTGEPYIRSRKNILFIPGGPGQTVNPRQPDLHFLEKDFNVVYFDVRGTGHSRIPLSKTYDKYLRGKYVVADIEEIRNHLNIDTWDAIYAHSWGTIVAQLYAEESEKRGNTGEETLVKKLILSAPVARGGQITEKDRYMKLVSNLKEIYIKYSSSRFTCQDQAKRIWEERVKLLLESPIPDAEVNRKIETLEQIVTSDFCFLSDNEIESISETLLRKLITLEEYGTLNLIRDNYDDPNIDLKNDLVFQRHFPYPKAFYHHLWGLQLYGGSEEAVVGRSDSGKLKTASALLLAYYLSLPDEALSDPSHKLSPLDSRGCQLGAPLLKNFERHWQIIFCDKINKLGWLGHEPMGSIRANRVFGVYDGLSRWIFSVLKNKDLLHEDGSFTGEEIQNLAAGKLGVHRIFEVEAARLHAEPSQKIQPWRPSDHKHSVTTLILTGTADPVIAGGQVEELFWKGLSGSRTWLKFPGVGHLMAVPTIKLESTNCTGKVYDLTGTDALGKIVSAFIREPEEGSSFIESILKSPQYCELREIFAQHNIGVESAMSDKLQ